MQVNSAQRSTMIPCFCTMMSMTDMAFTIMVVQNIVLLLLGCWVLLDLTFIASTVVATMRMCCQGHVAHGTSLLYTEVQVSMLFIQLRAEYITYTYLGINVTHVWGMCSIDKTKKWGTTAGS